MTARIEGIEPQKLREQYEKSDMSMQKISNYYSVGIATIWRRIKEYGIIPKTRSECVIGNTNGRGTRKYHINEDFFKTETPEMTWLFGWSLGDGSYTNPHFLRFNLGILDREVLEKFKSVLDSEHPITDYDAWSKKYQKYSYMSRIVFRSITLISDLKEITLYGVSERCFNHALRGFFEAEGSVYWLKRNNLKKGNIGSSITQNDKKLLDFIRQKLREFGIVKGGSIRPYKTKNSWKLVFSKYDSICLYHYLYDNCGNAFLKRKKSRFEELIGREEEN